MAGETSRKRVGNEGEALAAKHLRRCGYRILERNYRTPCGEIDLIAEKEDETVFIEVRTVSQKDFGEPVESLTTHKIDHWKRAALCYLQNKKSDRPFHFAFVGIDLSGPKPVVTLWEDIL